MTLILNVAIYAIIEVVSYSTTHQPCKDVELYHTSILSGEGWMLKLLTGHPDCIRNELYMSTDLFQKLIIILSNHDHTRSRFVSLEEQLAIFLYICVIGLPLKHVGEQFQQSNGTISW